MTHSNRTAAKAKTQSPHWVMNRSQSSGPVKLLDLGANGFGRREFLTMAGIGSVATAVCVTIAALDPSLFFTSPW